MPSSTSPPSTSVKVEPNADPTLDGDHELEYGSEIEGSEMSPVQRTIAGTRAVSNVKQNGNKTPVKEKGGSSASDGKRQVEYDVTIEALLAELDHLRRCAMVAEDLTSVLSTTLENDSRIVHPQPVIIMEAQAAGPPRIKTDKTVGWGGGGISYLPTSVQ